jgi:hypothetical protein
MPGGQKQRCLSGFFPLGTTQIGIIRYYDNAENYVYAEYGKKYHKITPNEFYCNYHNTLRIFCQPLFSISKNIFQKPIDKLGL